MTKPGTVGIGLIGAGMISNQYLTFLAKCSDVNVVAIGDLDTARAAAQAAQYEIASSGTPDSVLANDDVEIVINLTIPAAHVEVSTKALNAGKHVWSEKPIGIDRASSKALLQLAADKGLLLGIAPDTVLGPIWQTAKRAIQAGAIGTPLSAVTAFQGAGPEYFHPNPDFLYARGAGPLFDIGPYYLTALVQLLGPITEVFAFGTKAQERCRVLVGPRTGETFPVEVPTHLTVVSRFADGSTASSLMSVDTPLARHGVFEVNGTHGTLVLGDPNYFGGTPIRLYGPEVELTQTEMIQTPQIVPEIGPITGRGVGALTMARAIRHGADLHVATGEVGYHVLDTMVSIEESVLSHQFVTVESSITPSPALPESFNPYHPTLEPSPEPVARHSTGST